jgi:hypothetical protein
MAGRARHAQDCLARINSALGLSRPRVILWSTAAGVSRLSEVWLQIAAPGYSTRIAASMYPAWAAPARMATMNPKR